MNERWIRFAQLVADRAENDMTYGDCYEKAGFKPKTKDSAYASAHKLLKKTEVQDLIVEQQRKITKRVEAVSAWDRNRVIQAYETVINLAIDRNIPKSVGATTKNLDLQAANAAIAGIARIQGYDSGENQNDSKKNLFVLQQFFKAEKV